VDPERGEHAKLAVSGEEDQRRIARASGGGGEHFIEHYNQSAQPFVWTKTADQILTMAVKQQPTSGTPH